MPNQMQMFFQNEQIEVVGHNEHFLVSAEIIGQVAVHQTPKYEHLWTVTHIQSGRAVMECIYEYVTAIAIAQAMKALDLDTYWNNGCCSSQAFYDEATRLIKDVAARYGLHHRYRIVGKVCEGS